MGFFSTTFTVLKGFMDQNDYQENNFHVKINRVQKALLDAALLAL